MLRLRPWKACDAENIVSWVQDEDTYWKWSCGRFGGFPLQPETLRKKYESHNGDCEEADNFYPMTAVEDSLPVGHLILRYTGGNPLEIRFGWVIVDASRRGNGDGQKMLKLAQKYAFEILKAQKITLGVFDDNPRAMACYQAVGFVNVPEKNHREILNGHPQGILEMEITAEKYFKAI